MTDNVILSAGTADGVTLATDDVGGIHYQLIKVSFGALDTATAVSTSNGLPVAQQGVWTVQPGNTANTTAWKVDGSAVTQPVSATSLPLPTGAATLAKQPALGTAGVAAADVITIQGIASMTKLLVTPDSVALPANQSVNVSQVAGTNADTNSGVKSAGTLRVVLATDQPALTNKLLVTPDSVALPANQSVNVSQLAGTTTDTNSGVKSAGTLRVVLATDQPQLTAKLLVTPDANSAVNVAQINGVTALMGNGVTGTGSPRVTIASDNTAFTVNAAQSGTWTVQPGNTANTTAWLASLRPATSGGLTTHHVVSAGSTNATNVKASAGQLYGWYIYNSNAAARKIAFHNTAGTPTAGASIFFAIVIPPNSAANVFSDTGIAFSTGIAYTMVTDLTDAGATAVASTDLVANLFYS